MNALVTAPISFGEVERLAVSIARSGLFGIRTPEQAIALMMISQAEGRHPALAARDYDIIQNRPAKKSEAMLRDFLQSGGKVEWHALSDTMADATFSHPQGGAVRINWDMKRVAAAGLAGKENYKRFPRQMLRSRTVSEGVRTVYPLATSGFYVPEEAADIPTGPTIDLPAVEPEPAATTEREQINQDVPIAPPRRTWGHLLDEIEASFAAASTRAEVDEVLATEPVQRAMDNARNSSRERLTAIIKEALDRTEEAPVASSWPGPDPSEMRRERERTDG